MGCFDCARVYRLRDTNYIQADAWHQAFVHLQRVRVDGPCVFAGRQRRRVVCVCLRAVGSNARVPAPRSHLEAYRVAMLRITRAPVFARAPRGSDAFKYLNSPVFGKYEITAPFSTRVAIFRSVACQQSFEFSGDRIGCFDSLANKVSKYTCMVKLHM